jgi:type IV pilus assembly protein PilW
MPAPRYSAGISLIELLVALAIGVVVMGGAMQVLIGNMGNSAWESQMAYIQENARFATRVLGDDIRQGGFLGCSSETTQVFNAVDNSDWQYYNGVGIQGFEQGQAGFPADLTTQWTTPASATPASAQQSDLLIIRRADDSADLVVSAHDHTTATFTLTQNSPLQPGDLFVVANTRCDAIGVAQVTGPGGTAVTLEHGGTATPGNCSAILKAETGFNCALDSSSYGGAGTVDNFKSGSSLMQYRVSGYYIGESAVDSTVPALYRSTLVASGGNATVANEEIVTGVEDMQLLYGVDTQATDPDGVADRFLTADEIATALAVDATNDFIADASSTWIGWDRVVSVRVQLTMRSLGEVRDNVAAQPFPNATTPTVTYSDRFLRQLVTVTYQVRNGARG